MTTTTPRATDSSRASTTATATATAAATAAEAVDLESSEGGGVFGGRAPGPDGTVPLGAAWLQSQSSGK